MHPNRLQRLLFIVTILTGVFIAAGLSLYGLRQNVNLYYTPKDMNTQKVKSNQYCRLGGMVKKGSVERTEASTRVKFTLTDLEHDVPVLYDGILPDLFREGQGLVVEGKLNAEKTFIATVVLAKHDARYVPKNMPYRKNTLRGSKP